MKRYKNHIKGSFIAITDQLLESYAFKLMEPVDFWVYTNFRKKDKFMNQPDISLTYNEVRYKLCPATYSKSLKKLVKLGFLEVIRRGGLHKQCNLFKLSDNWKMISEKYTEVLPTPYSEPGFIEQERKRILG